jgi:thioredoxin reductase
MRVGVLGWGRQIAALSMYLLTWTDRLTVLTHGHEPDMPPEAWAALERHGIPVERRVIDRVEHGTGGCMTGLAFHGGGSMEMDAMFFHVACGPGSTLAADLGCEADEEGILNVTPDFETTVPGVYAAGDITPGSRLAIRAAGEGTRAAIGIQKSLIPQDRRLT